MCECFARCEADCVCDHDWTPPEVIRLRAELADLKSCACSDCNQEVLQLRAELAKADGQINRCVDQNRYLERLLSEAARDVSIVTFLRCGGWEVLQNPKYWTPENKFFGAIAEAMAEVAMAGGSAPESAATATRLWGGDAHEM